MESVQKPVYIHPSNGKDIRVPALDTRSSRRSSDQSSPPKADASMVLPSGVFAGTFAENGKEPTKGKGWSGLFPSEIVYKRSPEITASLREP